ncbi:MAG TPA: hypothetical protein VIQ31_35550, partial [Phormidium sp.]
MRRYLKLLAAVIIGGIFLLNSQQVVAEQWRPVKAGINFGISGMALVERKDNVLDLLIVHDNKGKDEGRLAIISIKGKNQPEYFTFKLSNGLNELYFGSDLEAV